MPPAASFALLATDAAALGRPLAEARSRVERPSAGLLFVAGVLGRELDAVARVVARAWPGVPVLISPTTGVITERGEHEGQPAAAGLLIGGGQASSFAIAKGPVEQVERSAGEAVDERSGGKPSTLVLIADPSGWSPQVLESLTASRPALRILGGGSSGEGGPMAIDEEGKATAGQLAGLLLRGAGSPRVAISPGCRMLGRLARVTEAKAGMILTLDGEPALDVLTRSTQGLEGRPLVLALLAPSSAEAAEAAPLRNGRVRPLRGVDPSRKGIMLGEPVPEGAMVGFATLDGPQARAHLEAALRDLSRATAGAAPRFGIYFNCAGRGSSLYGAQDVDAKLLRARFDGLPIAGMMSSFEIAPTPERATSHYYTGVFGLFTSPS